MKKLFVVLTCLAGSVSLIKAQTIFPALLSTAGTANATAGFMLSYSIGEPITETYSGADFILTQGFQQADTIIVTKVNSLISATSSVYPNPFKESIAIQLSFEGAATIMNATGQIIMMIDHLEKGVNHINTYQLANGLYTIYISDQSGRFESVRIEKLN
jgi:hypothetical protein